jgi:hypothetical protein
MLRFFRKIRWNIVRSTKLRRYGLYALGEIGLVVIGILIALGINNAYEETLLRKKEQVYLQGLEVEFQTSQKKLEELIRVNAQSYQSGIQILQLIEQPENRPSEKAFSDLLIQTLAFDLAFNPNNSLLMEMISSGSLKDLSDAELRKQLTNWISTLEDIAKQETELAKQREKLFDLFVRKDYNLRTILDLTGMTQAELGLTPRIGMVSNLDLLEAVDFENQLLLFLLTSRSTETEHYRPLLEDLHRILELIEEGVK